MALFRFGYKMFVPYLLTYIGSVAAHTYVTRYHSHMTDLDMKRNYGLMPVFLLIPYIIQPSYDPPCSDPTYYHCWICWENKRFSHWDLVAFAFHLLFVSMSVIERFYTNSFSWFTLIYPAIRFAVCYIVFVIHIFKIAEEDYLMSIGKLRFPLGQSKVNQSV